MLEVTLVLLDRYRRWIQVGLALAVVAAALFVPRLEVDDSPERWTPKTTMESWKVFERHFQFGDTLLVGLHFQRPVRDDDLPRLRRLREQLATIDGVRQVYDCSLVAEQIEAVPLTTLLDPDHAERFSLYAAGLWDAPRAGQTDRTLLAVCELEYSSQQDKQTVDALNARRRQVAAEVERIVEHERGQPDWGPGVDFHVASSLVVMQEMERRTRQIAYTFLPISICMGLLALLLGFGSLRAVVVAVAGSGVAMLLVLGWLAAGGGTLGAVTTAAPTLMSIVGIACTVHMAAYAAAHGTTGNRFPRLGLIREVGIPCLGAAMTTGVGFLMLRFNELRPIGDLGTQLFAGSMLSFLGVFIVSQLLPIRRVRGTRWITDTHWQRFARVTSKWPRTISLVSMTTVVLLIFVAWPRTSDRSRGVQFDTDPFSFFTDEQPIAQALAHFGSREFGIYQLDVVLVPKHAAPTTEGLGPPSQAALANQQAAWRFSEAIATRRDLGVSRVVSTHEFQQRYQQFQQQLAQVRQQQGWLAFAAQLGRYATSAHIFNQTFQSWNFDKQGQGAVRITFLAHDRSGGFHDLVQTVRENLPRQRFDCYLTGSIAQSVDLSQGLLGGMAWGLGLSLVVMTLLCGALFRSLRLTLVALVPNLFPIVAIYGGMTLAGMPVNCGSAMVLTIALGIALNDTIHFMLHYRRLTRVEGLATAEAVTETIRLLGRPIVMTSLVHAAGFSIFLLTDFQPLYDFGLLSSLTMLAALVGDLIVLPNLLLVFDPAEAAEPAIPTRTTWPAVEVSTQDA